MLARHLLQHASERQQSGVTAFSRAAMTHLCTADWPGNVRQLVNVIEQCVALSPSPVIPQTLVQQAMADQRNHWPTLAEARDRFERQYLIKALKMTEGNVARAATLIDRSRTDLYKLFKKHDIDPRTIARSSDAEAS